MAKLRAVMKQVEQHNFKGEGADTSAVLRSSVSAILLAGLQDPAAAPSCTSLALGDCSADLHPGMREQ